jgi:hypothetical protein
MELRKRIEKLTEELNREVESNRDYVRGTKEVLEDLKYSKSSRVFAGDDFSIDIDKAGYLKMETSYSNQEISIHWIERLERLYKIVDIYNLEAAIDDAQGSK